MAARNIRPTRAALVIIAGVGLTLSACSDNGYNREDLFDQLTSGDGAATEEQANCVLDGIEDADIQDAIGEVDNFDELSEENQAALEEILTGCQGGESPTTSVPVDGATTTTAPA